MNKFPRFFACYPPGIPAAGGDFAIQRAGQLDRYKRISGLFMLEEGFIEPAGLVFHNNPKEVFARPKLVPFLDCEPEPRDGLVLKRRTEPWQALDPATIDEPTIAAHLYTPSVPDPELVIRTSGEMRISNFLLWQIAYSELWVTDTLWPDFDRSTLLEAMVDFQGRARRFGGN